MAKRPPKDPAALFESRCDTPLALSVLGGRECALVPEGYEDDEAPEDFHAAVAAFIASPHSALLEAGEHVYAYDDPTLEDVVYRRRR